MNKTKCLSVFLRNSTSYTTPGQWLLLNFFLTFSTQINGNYKKKRKVSKIKKNKKERKSKVFCVLPQSAAS
jgi:hypothetical protein